MHKNQDDVCSSTGSTTGTRQCLYRRGMFACLVTFLFSSRQRYCFQYQQWSDYDAWMFLVQSNWFQIRLNKKSFRLKMICLQTPHVSNQSEISNVFFEAGKWRDFCFQWLSPVTFHLCCIYQFYQLVLHIHIHSFITLLYPSCLDSWCVTYT